MKVGQEGKKLVEVEPWATSDGERESEPVLSFQSEDIIDEKGYTASIVWKLFGYLRSEEAEKE